MSRFSTLVSLGSCIVYIPVYSEIRVTCMSMYGVPLSVHWLRSDCDTYIYSWYSSVAQRHGVWHLSPVDESMLLTLPWCFHHSLHIPHTAHITDNEGPANHQPLFSTRRDDYIYLATVCEPTQHRTTHVLAECPSTISYRRSSQMNLTSNNGIQPSSAQPRPQLGMKASAGPFQVVSTCGNSCHAKDMPLGDDDVLLRF